MTPDFNSETRLLTFPMEIFYSVEYLYKIFIKYKWQTFRIFQGRLHVFSFLDLSYTLIDAHINSIP